MLLGSLQAFSCLYTTHNPLFAVTADNWQSDDSQISYSTDEIETQIRTEGQFSYGEEVRRPAESQAGAAMKCAVDRTPVDITEANSSCTMIRL